MKLSSQEEYGLRCLLRIARKGDGGSLTIPEISEVEGIRLSDATRQAMAEFDRKGLSPEERRRAIIDRFKRAGK